MRNLLFYLWGAATASAWWTAASFNIGSTGVLWVVATSFTIGIIVYIITKGVEDE